MVVGDDRFESHPLVEWLAHLGRLQHPYLTANLVASTERLPTHCFPNPPSAELLDHADRVDDSALSSQMGHENGFKKAKALHDADHLDRTRLSVLQFHVRVRAVQRLTARRSTGEARHRR